MAKRLVVIRYLLLRQSRESVLEPRRGVGGHRDSRDAAYALCLMHGIGIGYRVHALRLIASLLTGAADMIIGREM